MEYLRIGCFSKISGLSIYQLRDLHKHGILVPKKTEESSLYRYYTADQLNEAKLICQLKNLNFTYLDISDFLSSDNEMKVEMIAKKRENIESIRKMFNINSSKIIRNHVKYPYILFVGSISPRRIHCAVTKEIVSRNRWNKILIIDQNVYSDIIKEYGCLSKFDFSNNSVSFRTLVNDDITKFIVRTKDSKIDLIMLQPEFCTPIYRNNTDFERNIKILKNKLQKLYEYDLVILNHSADTYIVSASLMNIADTRIITVLEDQYDDSLGEFSDILNQNSCTLLCRIDKELRLINYHCDNYSELLRLNVDNILKKYDEFEKI